MDGHSYNVGMDCKSMEAMDFDKNGPTILILDKMSAHMTASNVRSAIAACGTFLDLILGGYTS
jgi:hypothetical protein